MDFLENKHGFEVDILTVPSWQDFWALAIALRANTSDDADITNDEVVNRIKKEIKNPTFAGTNMEMLQFVFLVKGIDVSTTHQLVRTRIGAGYSQKSFRAMDISDSSVRIPPTVSGQRSDGKYGKDFSSRVKKLAEESNELYKDMIDAGVPYQDARRHMQIGTTTYIVLEYNYRTLYGVIKRKLCKSVQ